MVITYLVLFGWFCHCHGIPLTLAPKTLGITLIGDQEPSFILQWQNITSADPKDPIVGYKVKVWEVKKKKTTKYLIKNKRVHLVEEEELPPLLNDQDPSGDVVELFVVGNSKHQVIYKGLKDGTVYEIGLQAVSEKGLESLTSKMRLTIAPKS